MLLKNRNRFGVALKVAIVFLAAFYIVWRLFGEDNISVFIDKVPYCISEHPFVFLSVIFLMPLNWLLESYKWKLIASTKVKISMRDAIKGVLAGVTIGTATPNRVGEFAGRIFMIDETNRVDLLLLSFISSFCQVFVTIVFGFVGLIGMSCNDIVPEYEFAYLFLAFSAVIFCTLPLWIRLFPQAWKDKISVVMNFPKKKLVQALFISAVRYLVYVCQFLLLFSMFNRHYAPPYDCDFFTLKQVFFLTMISYFMVTMIPTFSFTEVFIRGTVAGTVFRVYEAASSGLIFSAAFGVAVLLWTINVAIPSLIGMIFVLKLKFFRQKK